MSASTIKNKITIKNLSGQTHILEYKPTKTVQQLFTEVMAKTGLQQEEIQLIYAGLPLADKLQSTLEECGVEENASIFLVARLKGGATQ